MEEQQQWRLATPDWRMSDVGVSVYEPSEDTFLLLDAVERELSVGGLPPRGGGLVVELGSGAGLVITALSRAWGRGGHPPYCCLAIDINPAACQATVATAALNNATVEVIRGDLLDCLRPHSVDVLLFNPPYVVTEPREVTLDTGISRSYAGGSQGRQVIDRLLAQLPVVMSLSPGTCCYLVVIAENQPEQIAAHVRELGFSSRVVMQRKAGIERLSVMKFVRV